MAKKSKNNKKTVIIIVAIVIVAVIALVLATFLDYSVLSLGIKIACSPRKLSYPTDYEKIEQSTEAKYDISYGSQFDNGYFDLYYPKNLTENRPLILYIHGGYYLGGDKKSAEPYCRALAAEGYVVANMNYALAPKYKYPVQLKQVNEILGYLSDNSAEYKIDPSSIFIGGDSAGSHLSAQAGAFYTNDSLAEKINIKRSVDGKNIKGLLLLCGFYDTDTVKECEFPFLDVAMWAFTDVKNYETYSRLDELNVVKNVTVDYPDAFVTCGSDDPFYSQAQLLVSVLEKNKVVAESYLPVSEETKLGHEFQRKFEIKEANVALEKVKEFLKERTEKSDGILSKEIHADFALSNGATFDVLLDAKSAPETVKNFIAYAEAGFYNGTVFHRILSGKVVQGGGYTVKDGNYSLKPPAFDPIKGEFSSNGYFNNSISHLAGVISMARTGEKNSATSQFFFCAADCSYYDGEYAAFGRIINADGIVALAEMADVEGGEVINPAEPITIVSVAIRYSDIK